MSLRDTAGDEMGLPSQPAGSVGPYFRGSLMPGAAPPGMKRPLSGSREGVGWLFSREIGKGVRSLRWIRLRRHVLRTAARKAPSGRAGRAGATRGRRPAGPRPRAPVGPATRGRDPLMGTPGHPACCCCSSQSRTRGKAAPRLGTVRPRPRGPLPARAALPRGREPRRSLGLARVCRFPAEQQLAAHVGRRYRPLSYRRAWRWGRLGS